MKIRVRFPNPAAAQSQRGRSGLVLISLLILASPAWAAAGGAPRVAYPESIQPIPLAAEGESGVLPRRSPARVVRTALTSAETSATMDFALSLRMRNFAELQARVARGDIIPREEMAEKYLPLAADYDQVVAWAVARGFTITYPDASHLAVFARGPVSRVAEIFQTTFGRVASDGGEYTSALTAPSVPMALAPALLGVNGLQPHLRAHKLGPSAQIRPMSLSAPNAPPYLPSEILQAYKARTTGLTGAGQTIAIVIDTYLLPSDLTSFWTNTGVSQSLDNITQVVVASGRATDTAEATIDAELTSSMAPGATIRMYTTGDLAFDVLNRAYNQIFNDLPSQPQLHQVNLSYGVMESVMTQPPYSTWQVADTQIFAALAAAGVSVIASTGDGGSNPISDGSYSASATLQPILPAADPSVTAVGGTTLHLDATSGAINSETGWSLAANGSNYYGSGGGISNIFSRPSWQTGTGVPPGSQRLVPDVSVVADLNTGAYIFLNGSADTLFGGTSISAPIWSGFTALLNQARSAAGQLPLGLLGPHIYPLIGTTSFHDITSGNNGAYTAGIGYDMVTGVGTPDVAALALALGAPSFAPTVTAQPVSQTVAPGQNITFRITAIGNPPPVYRWQRRPVGSATWTDLANAAPYGGTATASLTVNSVTEAMSGDSFQCVLTNSAGTTTALPAVMIVASPLVITTLAGSPGNSGNTDGAGSTALFDRPSDLAVDTNGNVYVTDTNNHTVRKITPAGVVSTLAGLAGTSGSADGTGSGARFNNPTGIAVDGSGDLYVADTDNHTIRKITPASVVTTVAGQAGVRGSTDGSPGRFSSPSDVTIDGSGNLIVADAGNDSIRLITPARVVSTLAGLAGNPGSADGAGSVARFSSPEGVAIDNAGNVYVADTNNHAIRKITPAGVVSTLAGLAGMSGTSDGVGASARFQFPADLAVDRSGNLFVADTDNHTIRKVSPVGATGTVAGQAGANGSIDSTGGAARFYYPTGIAVDSAGDVYVADTNNNTIRKSIVLSGPTITTQPQSQTATAGTTVQFSVVATGSPAPSYQWRFNDAAIVGEERATLTLNNVQSTNAGAYTVVVTNVAGSVTSNQATLTFNAVTPPPSGGGSGGGSMEAWLVIVLALFCAARWVAGRDSRRPALCRRGP